MNSTNSMDRANSTNSFLAVNPHTCASYSYVWSRSFIVVQDTHKTMAREPKAPESLPNYIADGLPKQSDENLHDVINYCEELLANRDQEPEIPDDAEIVEDDDSGKGGSIVSEKVKCGKESCHCADGDDLHGPYLYRYWSESGETKKEYVGKPN